MKQPRAMLFPLMLVIFISTLDQTIVAAALTAIGRDLGNLVDVSWVATAYLLTSAVSTLVLGKIGDLRGRKRVLQASIAVFLVGSLACGLAPSLGWLIAFRAIQGLGGGLSSLVQAVIGEAAPERERPKYQALIGIVGVQALVLGPILGGVFSQGLSWRWIFYINVPIGLLGLIMVQRRIHLSVRNEPGRADVGGGLLITGATTAVLLLSVWAGTKYDWLSPQIVLLAVVGAFGVVVYVIVELRAEQPLTPVYLFGIRAFSGATAISLLSTVLLFVPMLYVPIMLQVARGYSPIGSSLPLIPLMVGLVVGGGASSAAMTRSDHHRVFLFIGGALGGGGLLGLSLLPQDAGGWSLAVPLLLTGTGCGMLLQVSLLSGQNAAPREDLGAATGVLNFFKTIGGALGAAAYGGVLTAQSRHVRGGDGLVHAFHVVFAWTAPVGVLVVLVAAITPTKALSEHMRQLARHEAVA